MNGVAQRTAPWTPIIEVAGTIATLPLTVSGDATIVTLGIAGKASRGTVTLFRGVSAGEAADIAATGELRAGATASGNEGKYVTNTLEAASKWAAQNGEGARVVQITVPADATRALEPLNGGARIDGIGYGWWGPIEAFKDAVIKFVETATAATPR